MPKTKGKALLTHARILDAAVEFADLNGLERLKMRALASTLDAGAMSLYHYFPSRDVLIDAMVEFLAQQIHRPDSEVPWREAVTHIANSAHQVMVAHEWVCAIWSKRTLGPHKLAFMESILRVLRQGGFSVADACDAYHAITIHIEGYSLHAAGFPVKPQDVHGAAIWFIESMPDQDAIPYFREHVQHHLDQPKSPNQFDMMLGMILDGFETRLLPKDQKPNEPAPPAGIS